MGVHTTPDLKERKIMVTLMIMLAITVAVASQYLNSDNNLSMGK